MQYRGQEFQYDSENDEVDADTGKQPSAGNQYRRKRSIHATRRRSVKKSSNHPGCGIGARRNNRWTW